MATIFNGLHGPNRALSTETYAIIDNGHYTSIKLLEIHGCQHSVAEAKECLKRGATNLMLRLPDSRRPDGSYPAYAEYADTCLALIHSWYQKVGCLYFQVDNEPNWQWMYQHYGPGDYQWFMKRAMQIIRQQIPSGVKLVCPPLSFASVMFNHDAQNPSPYTLNEWHAAYDYDDHGAEPSLWHFFDVMGANSYWRESKDMADPSLGKSYYEVYLWAGQIAPVCVLEWGSTIGETGSYTAHELEMMRCSQYPQWIEAAKATGVVDRCYCWLSPTTTPDWYGDQLSVGAVHCLSHL